jgi:hypothetical protein
MIYFYDNYNPDEPNNVINYIDFNTTKTFEKSLYSIIHKNKIPVKFTTCKFGNHEEITKNFIIIRQDLHYIIKLATEYCEAGLSKSYGSWSEILSTCIPNAWQEVVDVLTIILNKSNGNNFYISHENLSFDFSKINYYHGLENIAQSALQHSAFKHTSTLTNKRNVIIYKLPTILNNNKENK